VKQLIASRKRLLCISLQPLSKLDGAAALAVCIKVGRPALQNTTVAQTPILNDRAIYERFAIDSAFNLFHSS
jgi:hypothetical protein